MVCWPGAHPSEVVKFQLSANKPRPSGTTLLSVTGKVPEGLVTAELKGEMLEFSLVLGRTLSDLVCAQYPAGWDLCDYHQSLQHPVENSPLS